MSVIFIHPYIVAPSVLPTGSNAGNAVSASDLSSYSFTSTAIGTAATGRLVVVVGYATATGGTPDPDISSITIAGVSGTVHAAAKLNAATDATAFIASAVVDTGTTGTIDVVWNKTVNRCGIVTYALYDLASTTPTDTATGTADAAALDVDTLADGIVVALSGNVGTASAGWTGATEDVAVVIEGSVRLSAASATGVVAATPRTVVADWSGTVASVASVAASWR